MPAIAPSTCNPPPPGARVSLPASSCIVPVSGPRPLVRSAGGLIETVPQPSIRPIYGSDEEHSGDDEPSLPASLLPAPHYSAVYASIRHGAAAQAQRARDRQVQLQLHNARMQQQKLIHAHSTYLAHLSVVHPVHVASPPLQPKPSLRVLTPRASTTSTSSTSSNLSDGVGSTSSTLSRYSEGDGSDRGSGSRPRRGRATPQHFRFSVDDIDKALTEEELDEWFVLDDQRDGHSADSGEEDDVPAIAHIAISSPSPPASLSSPSSSSSSSSSAPPDSRPSLSINTFNHSPDSSTIPLLPSPSSLPPPPPRHGPPQTFTFSHCDVRKSEATSSEELSVGHWSKFPKPAVGVCDVRMLRGRLREKRDEWEREGEVEEVKGEEKVGGDCRRPSVCRRLFVDHPHPAAVKPQQPRQPQVMWRRDAHSAQVAPLLYHPQQSAPQQPQSHPSGPAAHRRSLTEQHHHTYFQQTQPQPHAGQQRREGWRSDCGGRSQQSPNLRYLYRQTSPPAPAEQQPVRVHYHQPRPAHAASSASVYPSDGLFSPRFQKQQQQRMQAAAAAAFHHHQAMQMQQHASHQHHPQPHQPHPSHAFYPSPSLLPMSSPSYPSPYYQSYASPAASHEFFYPSKPAYGGEYYAADAWTRGPHPPHLGMLERTASHCEERLHYAAPGAYLPMTNVYTRQQSAPYMTQ